MIKDIYFIIGVIYLIIAVVYAVGIILSASITIINYATGKETDTNSLSYKAYLYYNNVRYGIFVILYLTIGILYILENHQAKKLEAGH